MTKNVPRFFTILLLLMILSTGLITAASAETIVAKDWTNDSFFYYSVNETYDTASSSDLIINSGNNREVYKITTSDPSSADTSRIMIGENVIAVLVFDNVNLTTTFESDRYLLGGKSPIQVGNNSTVTIVLLDGTSNFLECNGQNTNAGIAQAGIYVPSGANLIIRGQEQNTGFLEVKSGRYSAGIGGGVNGKNGNITIDGGNISASTRIHISNSNPVLGSGNGAGIGSGGGNTAGVIIQKTYPATITISGKAIVNAVSGENGAGIGGGSSNLGIVDGGSGETIRILGDADVTAESKGNGAGIGSGGTDSGNAENCEEIYISGNATVNASSGKNGAGIGNGGSNGAGSSNGKAGTGGLINISGTVNVNATSEGNGAGIGGGGSNSRTPGAGGNTAIFGTAHVTAESKGNGAGIGGGGSDTGSAGAGGTITVKDKTTIIAISGNANDIGPGTNGILGADGLIQIIGGNVYAVSASEVTNAPAGTDILNMVNITASPGEELRYSVLSNSAVSYSYNAIADGAGNAYIWLPKGSQLVICRDAQTSDELQNEIITLTAGPTPNEIQVPAISGFTAVNANSVFVTWDDGRALDPIEFLFDEVIVTPPSGGSGGNGSRTGSATIIPSTDDNKSNDSNNNLNDNNNNSTNALMTSNLTIKCVDKNGKDLFVQSVTVVASTSEKINAPSLRGYKLEKSETQSRMITIAKEDTVVTFKYVKDNSGIIHLILAFLCGFTAMFIIHLIKTKK